MGRGILHKRVHHQRRRRELDGAGDHMLAAAHQEWVIPDPPPPMPEVVTLTRPQFDSLLARLAALEAKPKDEAESEADESTGGAPQT